MALIIPTRLAADVTCVLAERRSLPPVLAHPCLPQHRMLLGSDPYEVPLPWPPGVHRGTGMLVLPPTVTPRGPLTWVHPPGPDTLHLCREIDIFGALRSLGRVGGGS